MSYLTLRDRLESVTTKDLLRVLNTNKDYVVFNFHVTNSGSVVSVHCTDNYEGYSKHIEDGYRFVICLYTEEYETIKSVLLDRLDKISKAWRDTYLYYTWDGFLKAHEISEYNYKRLLRLKK